MSPYLSTPLAAASKNCRLLKELWITGGVKMVPAPRIELGTY